MSKNQYITHARELFAKLEDSARPGYEGEKVTLLDAVSYDITIRNRLLKAGVSFAALDPTGESDAQEMQSRLEKALQGHHLASARRLYAEISQPDVENLPKKIKDLGARLLKAKAGYGALDVSGQKSDAEIRKEIQERLTGYYVDEARQYFQALQDGSRDEMLNPDDLRMRMDAALGNAQVRLTALDPEGKKGLAQMQRVVNVAVQNAHLRHARRLFSVLEDHYQSGQSLTDSTADTYKLKITSHLRKAEKSFGALDVNGRSSDRAMEQRLNDMVTNIGFALDSTQLEEEPLVYPPRSSNGRRPTGRRHNDEESVGGVGR